MTAIWEQVLSAAGAESDLTPAEEELFTYMVEQRIARVPDEYTIRGWYGEPDRPATPEEIPGVIGGWFAHYYRSWVKATPPIFRSARIESLASDRQHRALVDEFVRGAGQTLFLAGPVGTGKSYAAWAVAHVEKAMFPRSSVKAWSVPRLLVDMRPDGNERAFDLACEADFLLLDDLAAAKPTDWAVEQIYSIAEARSSAERRTVLTTNATYGDLCAMWGEPTMDRLKHKSVTAVFKGDSLRKSL